MSGRGLVGWVVAVAACLLALPALAHAASGNDNFATAFMLSGSTATATGSNAGATKEAGEPAHAGRAGGHSVWWRWTAPDTAAVTVDTCESDFDTLLAVYTGTSVSALTVVKSNDDACDFGSSVTFAATSGQVYWIAVDGQEDEEGNITLKLQRTLTVDAATITRPRKVDAIRLSIEVAVVGDEEVDVPQLTFERGGKRLSIDLEFEGEGDSETTFKYTFNWLCGRNGEWRWRVSVERGGETVFNEGSFAVPACQRRGWFVSRSKVVADFARDFGWGAARFLRCSPAGARRGSLAPTWRCGMVQPGRRCVGGFLFRYSRVFQAGDMVESRRIPSGSVTCYG